MAISRLYLVRHARTIIDPTRPHHQWELDPAGKPLLDELAALPCWGEVARLFSSTEPKAQQTAAAIAAAHGLPPAESREALGELRKPTFSPNHDAAMAALFGFPDRPAAAGWETAQAALARLAGAVRQLLKETEGQSVAVVSHGTVLALYIAQLQGQQRVNPADWRAMTMPDLCVVDSRSMQVLQPFGAWRAT